MRYSALVLIVLLITVTAARTEPKNAIAKAAADDSTEQSDGFQDIINAIFPDSSVQYDDIVTQIGDWLDSVGISPDVVDVTSSDSTTADDSLSDSALDLSAVTDSTSSALANATVTSADTSRTCPIKSRKLKPITDAEVAAVDAACVSGIGAINTTHCPSCYCTYAKAVMASLVRSGVSQSSIFDCVAAADDKEMSTEQLSPGLKAAIKACAPSSPTTQAEVFAECVLGISLNTTSPKPAVSPSPRPATNTTNNTSSSSSNLGRFVAPTINTTVVRQVSSAGITSHGKHSAVLLLVMMVVWAYIM